MEEFLCGKNCIPSDGMERKRKRKSKSSHKGEGNESDSSKGTPSAVDPTGVSLGISTSLMHEDAPSLNEPKGKRKNKKKMGIEKQDEQVTNTDDNPMFVEGPSCASHDSHESSEPVDGSNPVAKKKRRRRKKKEMEVTHSNGTSIPAERPDSVLQELAENIGHYRKSKKKEKEEVEATEQHDTNNSIGGAATVLQEFEAKTEVDGDLKKKKRKKKQEMEVTHSKETSMPAEGLDSALQDLNENIELSRKSKKKNKEKKEEAEAIEHHDSNNSAGRSDSSLQELNEKTAVDGEIKKKKKKLKKNQKQEVINTNDSCASEEGQSPLLQEVNVKTKLMGESNNLIGKKKRRKRQKAEDISAPDKCLTSTTELAEMDLENTVECSMTPVHQNGALEGLEKNQHLSIPAQAALSVASVETSSICLEEIAGLADCSGNLMLHDHQQGTAAVVSDGNTSTMETQDDNNNGLLQIVEKHSSHILLECHAANCNGRAEQPEHKIPGEDNDIKDTNPPASEVMVSKDIVMETIKEDKPRPIFNSLLDSSNIQISRKKLLILDLNGLLVDVVPAGGRKPDMVLSGKYVYKRPFVDDFIQFCLNTFSVAVWSSRKRRNIDQLIKFLFGRRNRAKMLFIWNQAHCTGTKYTTIENKDKPLVLKELKRVWEMQGRNLPWEKGEYNESNTLLLDDSPYKALRNPENTAIFPHSYQHAVSGDNSLGPGGDIRVYLEKLALAENVPEFVRQNPFGQGAITSSDPAWDFYEQVLLEGKKSRRSRRVFQSRWDR